MYKLYQTIDDDDLKANTNHAFALIEQGPVVILSRTMPKAVLVAPNEWNRIAERLKMLEALQEAQRIEARNNADHSWVSSSEMRERMAKRGVNVGSPL